MLDGVLAITGHAMAWIGLYRGRFPARSEGQFISETEDAVAFWLIFGVLLAAATAATLMFFLRKQR